MELIFNYEDMEEDFTRAEQVFLERRLVQIFVDPGYELEYLNDVERFYLEELRKRFESRKDEIIPYGDIRAAMYKITNDNPKKPKMGKFKITHTLRNYWRAGEIQRFVLGRSRKREYGKGGWYGIHYKLFKEEENVRA